MTNDIVIEYDVTATGEVYTFHRESALCLGPYKSIEEAKQHENDLREIVIDDGYYSSAINSLDVW